MKGEFTVDSSIVISFIRDNDVYKITYTEDNKEKEIRGHDIISKYIRYIESNSSVSEPMIHIDVDDERRVYEII